MMELGQLAYAVGDALTWADGPVLAVTVAVWWYWAAVVVLAELRRRRLGGAWALRGRKRADRWLIRGWAVVIVAWNVLPAIALHKAGPPFAPFAEAHTLPLIAVRWLAAAGVVGCLLVTVACWVEMGRAWSVAIMEADQAEHLVTTGLYRLVRHPIYALSVAMVLLTAIAVASWPMAAVACIHVALMHLKARREEQALVGVFGKQYRDYINNTGRFLPRFSNDKPRSGADTK